MDAAFERWRELTPDPAEAHLTRGMALVFNNRAPGELEPDLVAATGDFLQAQQLCGLHHEGDVEAHPADGQQADDEHDDVPYDVLFGFHESAPL